jgi:hypothetical protein
MLLKNRPEVVVLPMDEVEKEYEEGASSTALAKKYGTTANTVRAKLVKRGVTIRKRGTYPRTPKPPAPKTPKPVEQPAPKRKIGW